MAQSLNVNGVTYSFPDVGEENWGQNVTNWAVAITAGALQKKGGTFTLTAEVDFGATYGLKTAYVKSKTANISTVGVIRLANGDSVSFRNAANDADLELKPKAAADGLLTYGGLDLVDVSTAQSLSNKTLVGAVLTTPSLGVATATSINKVVITAPATAATLTLADGSTLALAGAYATTLTATAATNVTLPTTGTLSTLAGAEALTNKTIVAGSNTITGIANANIDAAAAIAYSKLNLSGSILNADINASAAIAYSKLNLATSILNADINASAAIAYSKLNLSASILNADISASAAIAYSKLNLATSIVNGDISASAAIAYSKLSLGTSIVNTDISASAAIAYSKLNLSASVVNADIHATAAIALSKLAALTVSRALVSDGSGFVSVATTTATEIGYINGLTSSAQTQLDARVSKSTLTTKGDIYVATGSGVVVRQGIGSDNMVLMADSAQTNGLKWGNVAAGAKNYIAYGNFENNATTGWTATGCATVTNGLPVSVGSAGAAFSSSNGGRTKGANTNSPAIDSGSLVSGVYALNLATTGAGVIGDGYISSLYTIDPSDQAKVLTWSLNFKVAAGTPVMSGLSTNTYAVAIYSPADNAWLPTTGAFSFTQSSGVGKASGTFQTNTTTTSVQLFVYSPVAPTGTSSLLIDDVFLGPQPLLYGPPVTDWAAATVTGSWVSNTTYTAFKRRVGDSYEYEVLVRTSGAPTSATLTLTLDATIDTTKLTSGSRENPLVGYCFLHDDGVQNYAGGPVTYASTNSVQPFYDNGAGIMTPITQAAPFTFAANDEVKLNFKVPIVGLSSSCIMSSDADTRVVAAAYYASANRAIDASTNANYDSKLIDTHNCMVAGVYTIPVSGLYRVTVSALSSTGAANLELYKTGVNNCQLVTINTTTQTTGYALVQCNAGNTLSVRADGSVTLTGDATDLYNRIQIERLSGISTIAASEQANCRYVTTSGQSFSSAATTIMVFGTKDYDSHGFYNTSTGVFTALVPGKFLILFNARVASVSHTVGSNFTVYAYKNGAEHSWLLNYKPTATVTATIGLNGTGMVSLNAGETMDLRFFSDDSGSKSLVTTANVNWLAINKVG